MIAYVPVYCCESEIPVPFREENNLNGVFNEKGAYWFCNMVSNFIYPRYSAMIGDLRVAQKELEDFYAGDQPAVEKAASEMTPSGRVTFLTSKTVGYAERMMEQYSLKAQTYIDSCVKPELKAAYQAYLEYVIRRKL